MHSTLLNFETNDDILETKYNEYIVCSCELRKQLLREYDTLYRDLFDAITSNEKTLFSCRNCQWINFKNQKLKSFRC